MSKRFVNPALPGPWCLVFLISLIWQLSTPAFAQSQPQAALAGKNVLILHDLESNVPILVATNRALIEVLESGGISIRNQFYENLDFGRNPEPEHRKKVAELLRQRYSNRQVDLIVTTYAGALKFALNEGRTIFPQAPIIALYLAPGMEISESNRVIIRHSTAVDPSSTLESALKLLPKTKQVYVVSGVHINDKRLENVVRQEFKKWEGRLEFFYLSDLPMEKILATVTSLPENSIVLLPSLQTDVLGTIFTTREAVRRVSQASNAPVFGLVDVGLGYGLVGGYLISYELMGRKAGELGLEILRSGIQNAVGYPKNIEVRPIPMYDGRQLKRWGLNASALPKGSIIINKETTFWDFRYYIIGALIFGLVESALIIFLIGQRRRKKVAEDSLRKNESDLRKLAGRLIHSQEEERSRLARELHDDLAQRLAVFAIDVGKLEKQWVDPPALVQEQLREMKNDIVRISQDVHSLSRQLHPSILDDLGLIKAAESECTSFSRREGIEIVFNHENIPRVIPKDVSLSLYRIIQEGLANISKHACAEHIAVSLKGIDHDVLLSVQDDGIGFDLAEVKDNPGLGFSSMRERARLIHGEFSIKSQPEKGTVITIRVPLTREGE